MNLRTPATSMLGHKTSVYRSQQVPPLREQRGCESEARRGVGEDPLSYCPSTEAAVVSSANRYIEEREVP